MNLWLGQSEPIQREFGEFNGGGASLEEVVADGEDLGLWRGRRRFGGG